MKKIFLFSVICLAVLYCKAQVANPYEKFGYEGTVLQTKHEQNGDPFWEFTNVDTLCPVRKMIFNYKTGIITFLNSENAIICYDNINALSIGQFVSPDPEKNKYPSVSPYVFVGNNPINAIDPDGRKIIFVNGYYMDNSIGRNVIGADKPGADYWGSGFTTAAQNFFGDYSKISKYNYLNGSSSFGGDMSGQDRYDLGYQYTKYNLKTITSDMVEGETIKMVTHSEGAGYGVGVAQCLIDNGYKVESIVHLSADEGDEFKTPIEPMTYQLGYKGDWITGNKPIGGVDKFGIAIRKDLGWTTVHGSTKSASVFKYVEDLKSVQTQQNIGMLDGKSTTWYSQACPAPNGTTFSNVDGMLLRNTNGAPLVTH